MELRARRFTFVLALTLLSVGLAISGRALEAEGSFERTLKVNGPVELDVGTGSGNIMARTGDASTVQVRGTIKASGGHLGMDEAAEKKIRYLESNPPIEQHGNIIEIGHIENRELLRNVTISYELVVPAETRLRASSGSGDQRIEGIAGPLDTSTGSGDVKVSHIGGEVHASAGSGDIELNGVKGDVRASAGSGDIRATGIAGGLKASTGSGDVKLEQTAEGDVEVTTGSGEVVLRNVRGPLRVNTASGNITVDGEATGNWNLHTASGGIAVQLPSNAGFDLHARTVSGKIHTDRSYTSQGNLNPGELSGKVGNGGPRLELSTVSGDIRVE